MVDLDKNIEMTSVTPNCRVALKSDSYTLHKILPNKVTDLHYDCISSALFPFPPHTSPKHNCSDHLKKVEELFIRVCFSFFVFHGK